MRTGRFADVLAADAFRAGAFLAFLAEGFLAFPAAAFFFPAGALFFPAGALVEGGDDCGWIVSPFANIATNFAIRAARVSGFFAVWVRYRMA